MKCLLDSNVLLWAVSSKRQLTPTVVALIEDDDNDLFVSQASIWELAIKVAKGKLKLPGSSVAPLLKQIENNGFTMLQIANVHIVRTESLPRIHRDPFDRLIIAQALVEGLTILTSDEKIPLYDVPVIWK